MPLCCAALTLALLSTGCATRFVAKSVDPLRPPRTAAWDPGELSSSTLELLAGKGFARDWSHHAKEVIAALEPSAQVNPAARRAVMEVALASGMRSHRLSIGDRGSAGMFLCAAEHAYDGRSQGNAEFQRFCRFISRYSVARLAELREVAVKNHVKVGREIAGPTRSYRVDLRREPASIIQPGRFSSVLPTDRFRVVGAREVVAVDGVGTPLVAKVQGPHGGDAAAAMTVADDTWVPLTATIEFGPRASLRSVRFGVFDRNHVESAVVGGRSEILAGDFTTPFAVRTRELNKQNLITLGILGFFRGDRLFEDSGLYPLEFPSSDKIPVVFVHGLISEPNDWRFLHNALLADPKIRERYQFWAFYYPTSLAVPWSATRLRQALANAHQRLNPGGRNPALSQMVLVGHSMGGLLSRMQIVSGGAAIYDRYFKKPPEKLRLSARERETIKDMFFFRPNPDIDEVIFICVPHQGSFLASNFLGKIARSVAKLPLTLVKTSANILTLNADALKVDTQLHPGTSIDSLNPGGSFASVLQELPMEERVKKFSIIGNRGKPGDPWYSSDGVVPYWSSHLEGVPETIIPSNHSGPEHPLAAERVKEILKQGR